MRSLLKDWRFQVGVIVVLALVIVLVLRSRSQKDPSVAVKRYFDCVNDRDAGCLYNLTGATERQLGTPSAGQLRRFFSDVYEPRMRGYEPSGALRHEQGLDVEVFDFAYQEYQKSDGSKVVLGAGGYRTEGSAIAWPSFAPLILALFQTYQGPGEEVGSNQLYLRAIEDLKPDLERIGISGVFINDDFDGHFYTWDEWEAKLKAQLELQRTAEVTAP